MRYHASRTGNATPNRRRRHRRIVGGLTAVAATLALAPVASAGKPAKNMEARETPAAATSDVRPCEDLSKSVTVAEIADAIGATGYNEAQPDDAKLTGAGVDVAVIDTGVAPIDGIDQIDGPDLSFDALDTELRHNDLHGHGTNMASIVQQVAPGSRIVDVKVGAGNGAVDVSQVIAAIDWVVANQQADGLNIRVINLAYSTDADTDYRTDPLTRAVENAWQNGIAVVAAGGNDGRTVGRLGNPARDPFVIAVGAARIGPARWTVPSWSSTGDGVRNPDIVAPGSSMLGAGVAGSYLATHHPDATCTQNGALALRGSGTSQAAAVVSGAAAMLLEQRPDLTPDQLKKLLVTNGDVLHDVKRPTHPAARRGHVALDLGAALLAGTPSVDSASQPWTPSSGGGSLEAARGTLHVGTDGDLLVGEYTAFGTPFDTSAHSVAQADGTAWSTTGWTGATWSGATWSGATWSGATWSGATWSGATWSGATWSGATWSGATWSGATWSGATWSGATWSGATWA